MLPIRCRSCRPPLRSTSAAAAVPSPPTARLQITGPRPLGAWRLEAKGQLQRHSLIEVADDTTGTESEAFNLLLQTASLDLLAHHAGVTFGISGVGQSNDASGREPIVPDGSILSGAE